MESIFIQIFDSTENLETKEELLKQFKERSIARKNMGKSKMGATSRMWRTLCFKKMFDFVRMAPTSG